MKPLKLTTFTLIVVAASATRTLAVVDQTLEVQGTNLVLSWPSQGYEYYMIEYRPTLDPSTPWIQLTNNYPANSTNRTTFIVPCCLLSEFATNLGEFYSSSSRSTSSALSSDDLNDSATELWAAPAEGPGDPVPFLLYPPGYPTNALVISERLRSTIRRQRESYPVPTSILASEEESDSPQPQLTSGGCNCTDKGFFRVWHIPDWLGNVTNYVFDGPTFIPADFKDYRDNIANIEVLLDGAPVADSIYTSFDYLSTIYWGMGVYFDLYPGSSHTLQLRTTIRLNDEVGDDSMSLVLSNLTRSITVQNEVTFTNWDDLIQNTNFTFHAQTRTNSTDWWIDIYDAYENYVNGGSGHTSNGQISWTWDLKDTSGNPRDDIDSDPFFYSYITFAAAGTGTPTTRTTPAAQTAYPDTGNWLVAYMDRYFLDVTPGTLNNVQGYYTNAVNGISGGPVYHGIPSSTFAIKFGTNIYSQQERNDSWAELKARLFAAGNRNFYYHGHGNADTIGADMHQLQTNGFSGGTLFPKSKAFLSSQNISNEITFNRYAGSRPYRFAWLDGCSTANGNWPGAFGVSKATNSYGFYTNSASNPLRRRPSTFVGWNKTVGTGGEWGNAQDAYNFRSEWMFDWMYYWQSRTVVDAFENARQSSGWVASEQLWGSLRVFGYIDLRMDQFNHKNDWRWP